MLICKNGDLHKFWFNITKYGAISGENQEVKTEAESSSISTSLCQYRLKMSGHSTDRGQPCREAEERSNPTPKNYSRSTRVESQPGVEKESLIEETRRATRPDQTSRCGATLYSISTNTRSQIRASPRKSCSTSPGQAIIDTVTRDRVRYSRSRKPESPLPSMTRTSYPRHRGKLKSTSMLLEIE